MDWSAVIKLLLGLGVQILGKLIPALGTFLGGPLGFLAGLAINYLGGLLIDWTAKLARYAAIDSQVHLDVIEAKTAQLNLDTAQKNPKTTEAEHAKALADFTAAVSKLGRFKLQ